MRRLAAACALALASCAPPAPPQVLAPVAALPPPALPSMIVSIAPRGIAGDGAPIAVIFANDLVAPSALESPADGVLAHFQLTPAIPGKFVLLTPRMVGYEPEAALPLGSRFAVRVSAGLHDRAGGVLRRDVAWTFTTKPIVLGPLPGANGAQPDVSGVNPSIEIPASDPLAFGTLVSHARLVDALDASQAVELEAAPEQPEPAASSGPQRYDLQPIAQLRSGRTYRIEIAPGVLGAGGNLAAVAPASGRVLTAPAFAFTGAGMSGEPGKRFTNGEPVLSFTTSVDASSAASALALTPAPPDGTPAVRADDRGIVTLDGSTLAPRTSYTVHLAGTLTDTFGQTLAKDVDAGFTTGDLAPALWAPDGPRIFPPIPALALEIATTNLPERGYRAAYRVLEPRNLIAHDPLQAADMRRLLPQPRAWPKHPFEQPLNETVEAAVPMHGLLHGRPGMLAYGVAAASGTFSGSVQLTDLGVFVQMLPHGGIVAVNRLSDGAPVARARIDVFAAGGSSGEPPCASGATSPDGTFAVRATAAAACTSHARAAGVPDVLAIARTRDDWAYARSSVADESFPATQFSWSGPSLARGTLVCDRGTYRAGETVRGVAFAYFVRDDRLGRGASGTFALDAVGPDGRRIAGSAGRPDAYGMLPFSFTLPRTAAPGGWTISVRGDARDRLEGTVRVSGAPSAATLTIVPPPAPVAAGATANVRIAAVYRAGPPLRNATVHVTIAGNGLQSAQDLALDAQGVATVAVPIPSGVTEATRYAVTASIAGAAGETITRTATFDVAPAHVAPASAQGSAGIVSLDRATLAPGATLHAIVHSPYPDADVYLSVVRSGVLFGAHARARATVSFAIPVTEAMRPNVAVNALVVRRGPLRPAASAIAPDLSRFDTVPFHVRLDAQRLQLGVVAQRPSLAPGARQTLNVRLTQADGTPVAGEVSLAVTDGSASSDAIDLTRTVYADRPISARTADSRTLVTLATPRRMLLAPQPSAPPVESASVNVPAASDDATVTAWSGRVRTARDGRASVSFIVPPGPSAWSVRAYAADRTARFASGSCTFASALPLDARAVLPPFVRPGDRFTVIAARRPADVFVDGEKPVRVRGAVVPVVWNDVLAKSIAAGTSSAAVSVPLDLPRGIAGTLGGLHVSMASSVLGDDVAVVDMLRDRPAPVAALLNARLEIASAAIALDQRYGRAAGAPELERIAAADRATLARVPVVPRARLARRTPPPQSVTVRAAAALAHAVNASADDATIARKLDALLALRTDGRWGDVFDDAAAMHALAVYAGRDAAPPSMTVTAILPASPPKVVRGTFDGFDQTFASATLPIDEVARGPATVDLQPHGGALHYTVVAAYRAPDGAPGSYAGLRIDRILRPLGAGDALATLGLALPAAAPEVARDGLFEVEDRLVTDKAVDNVLVTDPLPGGFAPINRSLHELGLADTTLAGDRVTAFAAHLEPGSYAFTYAVRAVAAGRYAWPGASAVTLGDAALRPYRNHHAHGVGAMIAAALVLALLQLAPEGGAALPSNDTYVATPPPPTAVSWTRIRLPAWLAKKRPTMRVRRGTEIFRVQDYRIGWNVGAHIYVRTVHGVGGVQRDGDRVVLETISGNRAYPGSANYRPIPGEYTLVFYAPTQQRSPLLRFAQPDFIVP